MNSDRSAQKKSVIQPMQHLQAGGRGDRKGAFTVAGVHPRDRRILVVTDNDISAKILGDAFESNIYEVLATTDISEAVRFTTTGDPGSILLMFPSLATTCDAARQLRKHTSTKIIAFSKMAVTVAEKTVALQSGCDDYRDAFLRVDKLG